MLTEIVVVDDRVSNRQILAKLAESLDSDVRVSSFAEPASALTWLSQYTPDLIVTDFNMPVMNGAQFVRKFREQPNSEHVPVIVVTSYEDRDYRYEALAAGATDYLLSPLDAVEFRARARNLLAMRRLHELELQLSERRFQLVVNTLPAMINSVDINGICQIANDEQCRFFGVDPQMVTGRRLDEVFGSDYGERHRELDRQLLTRCEIMTGIEEVLLDRHGEPHVFLSTKAPLKDASDRPASVVTISVDITARKRFEQDLAAAKDGAEASSRAKSEFLANMSHELRTPLNAIIGFADMMSNQRLGPIGTPKYLEYSRDIWQSAQHLLGIISDILDLSQLEGGKLRVSEQKIAPDQLIAEVGRILQPQSESSGVVLEVNIAGPLPEIFADALRMKQALLNIVGNAIKFTPAGGRVDVKARREKSEIQIEVADTGIGMSETEIKIALTRFGRVETAITRRYPGAGLGLPIAADLVRRQGGRFEISSMPGKGTRVTISFPVAHCDDLQPPSPRQIAH